MVRCQECKSIGREHKFADPYETGLRSQRGSSFFSAYVFPTKTDCNVCGTSVRVSGWLERDPHK